MSLDKPFFSHQLATTMQTLGDFPPELPELIEQSGQYMAQQVVSGQKIIIAGFGKVATLAAYFYHELVFQPPDQRPALPAFLLDLDTASATSGNAHTEPESSSHCPLLRPFESLAQEGDVLLLLCDDINLPSPSALLDTAIEKGTHCIALSGTAPNGQSRDRGISLLQLKAEKLPAQHLLTLFTLQCLSDVIDQNIFGGQ